jgi:hypothetical protein
METTPAHLQSKKSRFHYLSSSSDEEANDKIIEISDEASDNDEIIDNADNEFLLQLGLWCACNAQWKWNADIDCVCLRDLWSSDLCEGAEEKVPLGPMRLRQQFVDTINYDYPSDLNEAHGFDDEADMKVEEGNTEVIESPAPPRRSVRERKATRKSLNYHKEMRKGR